MLFSLREIFTRKVIPIGRSFATFTSAKRSRLALLAFTFSGDSWNDARTGLKNSAQLKRSNRREMRLNGSGFDTKDAQVRRMGVIEKNLSTCRQVLT